MYWATSDTRQKIRIVGCPVKQAFVNYNTIPRLDRNYHLISLTFLSLYSDEGCFWFRKNQLHLFPYRKMEGEVYTPSSFTFVSEITG